MRYWLMAAVLGAAGGVVRAEPAAGEASGAVGPSASGSLARQLEADFVAAFEKVAGSVVVIEVERAAAEMPANLRFFFQDPENGGEENGEPPLPRPDRKQANQGSGFIIRADGYVVSNHHVVDKGEKFRIRLRDGRQFPAKVVGTDSRADLAVLKVEAKDLPAAKLGRIADIRIGQWTIAIGAPFDLEYSYSVGWLSGKGRGLSMQNQNVAYVQTTAPINPGNSGGPLCNIDGEVIGVNTLIRGIGTGVGFAVPVDRVEKVAREIIEKGRVVYPWLGVGIKSLKDTPEEFGDLPGADSRGVVVQEIRPDTPAEKSKLMPRDVITAVDGRAVDTAADLQTAIAGRQVGDEVKLKVTRFGPEARPEEIEVLVKLAEMPASTGRQAEREEAPVEEKPKRDALGLEVAAVNQQLVKQFGLRPVEGVVVMEMDDDSPAAEAGLRVGSIISAVNHVAVKSVAEYTAQVKKADLEKGVLLHFQRQGVKTYATVRRHGAR